MDRVDLHGIFLVLLLVLALIVLTELVSRGRKGISNGVPPLQIFASVLLAFFLFAVCTLFSVHACSSGVPLNQWALPVVMILGVGILIRTAALRWSLLGILFSIGILLCSEHSSLVHSNAHTGSRAWAAMPEKNLLKGARILLQHHVQHGDLPEELEAGWLDEVVTDWESLFLEELRRDPTLRTTHPEWHTWITHIYQVEERKARIWYPGGPVAKGALRLELHAIQG